MENKYLGTAEYYFDYYEINKAFAVQTPTDMTPSAGDSSFSLCSIKANFFKTISKTLIYELYF